MDVLRSLLVTLFFLTPLAITPGVCFAQNQSPGAVKPVSPPSEIRVWAGPSGYSMDMFNELLKIERNNSIRSGFSVGVEFSVVEMRFPASWVSATFRLPLGVEYLSANSTTRHADGSQSATVIWTLPVVSFTVAPLFSFGEREMYYFHPGIGFHILNRWPSAKLSVTDRSGHLAARSCAPGATVAVGAHHIFANGKGLFAEIGYRFLRFSSVEVSPVDNFPDSVAGAPVRAGALASALDYRGPFVRLGFALR